MPKKKTTTKKITKKKIIKKKTVKKIVKKAIKKALDKPVVKKKKKYFFAVGKRKSAIAKIWLEFSRGNRGLFLINHKRMEDYFPFSSWQYKALESLKTVGQYKRFDVFAKVKGGGMSAQSEAVRLGISRALFKFNADFRKKLKRAGLLTRDPRVKERKKYGLKRARRAPQFSKR